MANFSLNLLAAWDDGEGAQPDPTKLPGLLNMAEARLQESVESFRTLSTYFESMQQRALEGQNNLKVMLSEVDQLPTKLAEAGQENLEAFEDLIVLVEDLLALGPDEDPTIYWEVLGTFEETSENLRVATAGLAEAANALRN